jgi:hypothetical protein
MGARSEAATLAILLAHAVIPAQYGLDGLLH